MINGYIVNITSDLIIYASCLMRDTEEKPLTPGNVDSHSLKDAFAVKQMDSAASGY